MAASSPKPPLFLFQVLEDEYAALHGEQPPDLGWQFRANHIIYAESLIARLDLTSQAAKKDRAVPQKTKPLRTQIKATADPDEVAKNALITYLRDELSRKKFTSNASGAELEALFCCDDNLALGGWTRRRDKAGLRERRDFLDVRGTIWLDSATYLARRLDLEYVDFDDSRGTVRVDFADVAVTIRRSRRARG